MPDDVLYSKTYQKQLLSCVFTKIKAILSYNGKSSGVIKTPTLLIRPTEQVLPITEDYGLSEVILIENNYFVYEINIIVYIFFISILNRQSWYISLKEIIIQY